jgi:hypothetical protein
MSPYYHLCQVTNQLITIHTTTVSTTVTQSRNIIVVQLAGATDFSLLHNVKTTCGAYTATYPIQAKWAANIDPPRCEDQYHMLELSENYFQMYEEYTE